MAVSTLIRLLAVAGFAGVAVLDWRYRLVPDRVWPPLLIAGIAAVVLDFLVTPAIGQYLAVSVATLGGFAALVVVSSRLLGVRVMGRADVWALVTLGVVYAGPVVYQPPLLDVWLPLTGRLIGPASLTVFFNVALLAPVYVALSRLSPTSRAGARADGGHTGGVPWLVPLCISLLAALTVGNLWVIVVGSGF